MSVQKESVICKRGLLIIPDIVHQLLYAMQVLQNTLLKSIAIFSLIFLMHDFLLPLGKVRLHASCMQSKSHMQVDAKCVCRKCDAFSHYEQACCANASTR